MIERKLVRFATAIGAAWWLARVVFSRAERRKIDHAIQAIDGTSTPLDRLRGTVRRYDNPTDPVWPADDES
jgi:hypothetical protein